MVLHDHAMQDAELDSEATSARNARTGLWLFAVYLAVYGGFVGVSAFAPDSMKALMPGGVNLAVAWGFALIVLALVLALVYGWLCRRPVHSGAGDSGKGVTRS